MASLQTVQAQNFSLSGSGAVIGATTVVLQSFKTIDGVNLTLADFGTIGYGTLEPGSGTLEEQISFSGVTQNANGTATLTGVKTVLFITPYTESSGLAKTHAGSTSFVISNTAGFYNHFPKKENDETITGQWTFNNTPIVPGTVSDASTTVKGVSKTSVAPASASDPIVVGTNDPRIPIGYAVDSVGTDSYAIAPSPSISAYVAGQTFTWKAGTANTGAATLAVSGLSAIAIKKQVSVALTTGDILANQIVTVVYDGTNMQLSSPSELQAPVTRKYVIGDSPATWSKPTGLKYVDVTVVAGGGGGGGSTVAYVGDGGGGGGETGYKRITADTLGSSETVTIGVGGAGGPGTSSAAGSTGGTTSFGAHVTAVGGSGGSGSPASGTVGGGAGGTGGTGADLSIKGGSGGDGAGYASAAGAMSIGGAGGRSQFGSGAGGTTAVNAEQRPGSAGTGYGGGGSGGAQANNASDNAGGDGTGGLCIVTEYY